MRDGRGEPAWHAHSLLGNGSLQGSVRRKQRNGLYFSRQLDRLLAGKLCGRHADAGIVLRWRWELSGSEGRALCEQSLCDRWQDLCFELRGGGLCNRIVLQWHHLRAEEDQRLVFEWHRVRHGVLRRWRMLQCALHRAVQGVQPFGQQWHLHATR
jgi:hypothetical protein